MLYRLFYACDLRYGVVTDLAVLREVLSFDGKPAALFVDASDTTQLADAVSRILADQALSSELRRNARGLKARYSVGTMVNEYVAILDHAIRPHATAGRRIPTAG